MKYSLQNRWLVGAIAVAMWSGAWAFAGSGAATRPADSVGEKIPSEDSSFKDFHSLGLVNGRVDIFRCASPVRDLGKPVATTRESDEQMAAARARMDRLYGLGIRTIVCLEDPEHFDPETGTAAKLKQLDARLLLERAAAKEKGIAFVAHPMTNGGPNSLEELTDQAVLKWLSETSDDVVKSAASGGVVFHCSAGHDRTGMVAAYIRMKYEHWPVEEAIAEMRRLGHNWAKYSKNGGGSSWHEDHLRAIAKMIQSDDAAGE